MKKKVFNPEYIINANTINNELIIHGKPSAIKSIINAINKQYND
jgi:hypothetical protein